MAINLTIITENRGTSHNPLFASEIVEWGCIAFGATEEESLKRLFEVAPLEYDWRIKTGKPL